MVNEDGWMECTGKEWGEGWEKKGENLLFKSIFFRNEKIQPIKLPYLCHVIQNAIATQEFDNRTKTRKCRTLIGQFWSRDLNTVIWLVEFHAWQILGQCSLIRFLFWKTCRNWPNQIGRTIQNAVGTQKFDKKTKTRKCGALIGQFCSRDLNTDIWLAKFSACVTLVQRLLLSLNTKEIRCFEKNTKNPINQIVLFKSREPLSWVEGTSN